MKRTLMPSGLMTAAGQSVDWMVLAARLVVLVLLFVPMFSVAQLMENDVLVGVANGNIDVYRNGALNRTLNINDGSGYTVSGLCFSTDRRYLYVSSAKKTVSTGTWNGRINRFDSSGTLSTSFAPGLQDNQVPSSCVVDASGYLYVEFVAIGGASPIIAKYDSQGHRVGEYGVATDSGRYGAFDLMADQRTLVYVTRSYIRRFDLVGNHAIENFADINSVVGSGNFDCHAVRVRNNGEIWASCYNANLSSSIFRLDANGRLLKEYRQARYFGVTPARFSRDQTTFLALAQSFTSVDTGYALRVNIETEVAEEFEITDDYLSTTPGSRNFVVYGEYAAASTQCSDGIDNDGNGRVDFPDDPRCKNRLDRIEGNCIKLPFVDKVVCLFPWRISTHYFHDAHPGNAIQPHRESQN